MIELILFGISAFAMICSVPIWLSKYSRRPRDEKGKDIFDWSFWATIISFIIILIVTYSWIN